VFRLVQRRTMSHSDMGIVDATTDTFILFENGVRRNLSLSETLSGWRLTEAMLLFNEGSFQAHWLGGYAWVKMGFRPTDDAWRVMKREAYGFMVQHVSVLRRKLDVTELMTQDRGWRTQDRSYFSHAGRRGAEPADSGPFGTETYAVRQGFPSGGGVAMVRCA
jgi:hypothetical protein